MSRHTLDQTLEVVRHLERARTGAEICAVLLRFAARFGAEHVLAGTIPIPGENRRQQRDHVILDHWPAGWAERYFSHGYLFRDPAIRRVASCPTPFAWTELEPFCRDNPSARRVMDEAGDFRLKNGCTVPLMTLDGAAAGFSFAGADFEIDPKGHAMLSLLATYALGRAIFLRGDPASGVEVGLSRREHEALQWAAEGKSEWEIGQLMGISEHGVDKHMRVIRFKLGTTSRTHAVAEGIRRGLIQ
jgi:LuxR family quorum sensing-dependent transcriptional regulator